MNFFAYPDPAHSNEGQCTRCHSASPGSTGYDQSPHWDVYSNVTGDLGDGTYGSGYANATYGIEYKIFNVNDMPYGEGDALNQSVLTNWIYDGALNYAAPYISTGTNGSNSRISANNYSKSVSFTVNENGSNTTFTAYYRKGSDSWSSVSSSSPSGTGGNGSSSNTTSTATLTSLVCGNTYTYYLYGSNSAGSSSGLSSNTKTFSITCNTGASLSGTPGTATEDSLFTWTPTVTAGTGGSDTLTYAFSSGPTVTGGNTSNVPSINSSSGQISWTPTEGNTQASFTIQVSDADADTSTPDTLAVVINANAVNDNSPVITTAQSSIPGATEDTPFSVQLYASDIDGGDTQTWDLTAQDDPGMSITSGGLLSWTPAEGTGVTGTFNVTARVRDAVNNQDTASYTITVAKDQAAPVISGTPIATQNATEDSLFSIDLDATDTDSPYTHTWSITSPASPPDDMSIDSSTGVLSWTPSTEADLTQPVTVKVMDDGGLSDTVSFNIDVTAIVDNLPVISTSSLPGGTEAIAYSSTLAFTDADIDGDSWTWSVSSGPTVQPGSVAPTNAFNLDSSTGEVTWTPANNETSLSFTARVTDSRGSPYYDEKAFTINISAVNDPPVITNAQSPEGTMADQSATENSQFSIDIDASDPDAGDTATWSIVSPVSKPDDMAIDSNGILTWTPTTDVSVTQPVTIRVTDSGNLTDEVSFNINVTPVIDNPPVITTVQADLPTNATEDIQSFDYTMTWTDADLEGDGWTWSLTAQDDPDIAINPSTGEITWSPVEGERGNFNITARVTDNGGFWDDINLVISVAKDNEAPIISGKPIATQNATEDTLFSFDIDETDTDIGDTQSWAITSPASLPDDMAISNTGVLTWTPGEGVDRTQSVTVQVTDEMGATDSTSFNIDVTAVNDAPVISSTIPDDSVEEHSSYSYAVQVTDSDPQDNTPDLDSNMTYSITNVSPTPTSTSPSIDATGLLTWTPGDNDARSLSPAALSQDYVISVSVADGGEDGQGPATQDFTITVTLLDGDSDTVPDYEDNCPIDSNTDQANNDGDSEGDVCDPDDDNDGISDIAENYNGLDPFDDTDAALDLDGDGLSNLAEFNTCTGSDINSLLTCDNIQYDSVPPVITHNGDFDLVAAGYLTYIDFSATATDGIDGPVAVRSDINDKYFRPGDHTVTWTAQDAYGNIATKEQYITIHPIVSLGGSRVLVEGDSGTANITFNGDIPFADFPVTLTYVMSGTATSGDYSITPASPIVLNSQGDLTNNQYPLSIDAINDGTGEGDETLDITLDTLTAGPDFGLTTTHKVIITEAQVPPSINLSASQNFITTTAIFGDQGTVTVNANAQDGNGDTLNYDWSGSDSALAGSAVGGTFTFDPAGLSPANIPAVFTVNVVVNDGINTVSQSIYLTYMADSLALGSSDTDGDGINDVTEGLIDSDGDGIPDYLDAYNNSLDLLYSGNTQSSDEGTEFIQTESGLILNLGEFAMVSNGDSPNLNMSKLTLLGLTVTDTGYVHFGSSYNFSVSGLSMASTSGKIVIPLDQGIPPDAEVRVYDPVAGLWFTFIENGTNTISSAPSDENGCPAPGNASYAFSGLTAYDHCLELTISDGGPNDLDGEVNGQISVLVGLAVADTANLFEPDVTIDESNLFGSNGPAGNGALDFFIQFLLLSALGSTFLHRKRKAQHKNNK